MALQSSGAISFNNINVELGVAGTTQASLGQASFRTLAGVASGEISMSNFYGKSAGTTYSFTYPYSYYSDNEGNAESFSVYYNFNGAESKLVNNVNVLAVSQIFNYIRTEFDLTVVLDGHRAQNFFTSVSGNGRTLNTSAASHAQTFIQQGGAATYWSWYSLPAGGAGNVLLPFVNYSNGTTTANLTFA